MKSIFQLLLLCSLLLQTLYGQIERCSTPSPDQLVSANSQYKMTGQISIPVFFHIIYSNTDNVSNLQLENQINVLNYSFSNSNISFYIEGITRLQNSDWRYFGRDSQEELNMTTSLAVDPNTLKQNFPNPFNPTTIIEFSLPTPSFTKVSVFNSIGQEVAVLKNEMLNPGIYKVKFNAANLSSGLYLYKIQSGDFIETKKMNFIK